MCTKSGTVTAGSDRAEDLANNDESVFIFNTAVTNSCEQIVVLKRGCTPSWKPPGQHCLLEALGQHSLLEPSSISADPQTLCGSIGRLCA